MAGRCVHAAGSGGEVHILSAAGQQYVYSSLATPHVGWRGAAYAVHIHPDGWMVDLTRGGPDESVREL